MLAARNQRSWSGLLLSRVGLLSSRSWWLLPLASLHSIFVVRENWQQSACALFFFPLLHHMGSNVAVRVSASSGVHLLDLGALSFLRSIPFPLASPRSVTASLIGASHSASARLEAWTNSNTNSES